MNIFAQTAYLVVISFITPPFQVPDEPQHYIRAYLVYKGNFFPQKEYSTEKKSYVVGGEVDSGIYKLEKVMRSIMFHPELKVTPSHLKIANHIVWGGESWQSCTSGSFFPPFFYFPTAYGIAISKNLELNVADSITLSRWINIAAGLVIASFAIALSGRCAFFITIVLMFPWSSHKWHQPARMPYCSLYQLFLLLHCSSYTVLPQPEELFCSLHFQ